MVTRIHCEEEDQAEQLAEAIDAAGHEVAVVKERFAGEDDDEALEFVVCTPTARDALAEVLGSMPWYDEDVFVVEED